ncbi:MAG: cobalamin biosynthesis protein [Methyloceanibacter sp.]|nr:cobalamin biosynthesis protein [Methyloceanibacter sp.]
MIVAGIGCRRGATAEEIKAAIEAALEETGQAREALTSLATSDGKGSEPGLVDAAALAGLELILIKPAALEAAGPRTRSFSPRVKEMFGVPSVAEAAALAAAGPDASLLAPRTIVGPVTCAIAGIAPKA